MSDSALDKIIYPDKSKINKQICHKGVTNLFAQATKMTTEETFISIWRYKNVH